MDVRKFLREVDSITDIIREQRRNISELRREHGELLRHSRKSLGEIKSNIERTKKGVDTLKVTTRATTEDTMNRAFILYDEFVNLSEGMLTNAVETFTSILSEALSSLGGGGFLGFLGGLLSFIPFLQEGGIVKGSGGGTPAIIGENYTDEIIIPLSRVFHLLNSQTPSEKEKTTINEGDIHIHIEGGLIHQDELEDILYRSARKGRISALKRMANVDVNDEF